MASESLTSFEEFQKLDIRVGVILRAEVFPEARKAAYKLTIDFGELGIRNSSAQITERYSIDELVGKQILAVVNFHPRKIAGFSSEVLVLGLNDQAGNVVLITTDAVVPAGGRLY